MSQNYTSLRFNIPFPHASKADENGITALSKELTPSLVLSAYIRGSFPWHITFGKVFWYSPDPRAVLYPSEFKLSKSLSKKIKKNIFDFRINSDFSGVINACSLAQRKNQDGTWISDEFIECYSKLYSYGFAISVETYQNGILVGGFYGLRLKSIFFGESMFSNVSDASKAALYYFCANAKDFGINLIDCQQATSHLMNLGAKEINRGKFIALLEKEFETELEL